MISRISKNLLSALLPFVFFAGFLVFAAFRRDLAALPPHDSYLTFASLVILVITHANKEHPIILGRLEFELEEVAVGGIVVLIIAMLLAKVAGEVLLHLDVYQIAVVFFYSVFVRTVREG